MHIHLARKGKSLKFRKIIALGAAFCISVLGVGTVVAPASAENLDVPRAYATFGSVVQGGVQELTGSNFEPGEQITLTLIPGNIQIGTTTATNWGSYSYEWTVAESIPADKYRIVATGADTKNTAESSFFDVLSANSDLIRIPYEDLITYDWQDTHDADGNILSFGSVTLLDREGVTYKNDKTGETVQPGTHQFSFDLWSEEYLDEDHPVFSDYPVSYTAYAKDGYVFYSGLREFSKANNVTLNPDGVIKASADRVNAGETITFTGSYFHEESNGSVKLYLCKPGNVTRDPDKLIGQTEVSPDGTFSYNWTVPADAPAGEWTIDTDSLSHGWSDTFTIVGPEKITVQEPDFHITKENTHDAQGNLLTVGTFTVPIVPGVVIDFDTGEVLKQGKTYSVVMEPDEHMAHHAAWKITLNDGYQFADGKTNKLFFGHYEPDAIVRISKDVAAPGDKVTFTFENNYKLYAETLVLVAEDGTEIVVQPRLLRYLDESETFYTWTVPEDVKLGKFKVSFRPTKGEEFWTNEDTMIKVGWSDELTLVASHDTSQSNLAPAPTPKLEPASDPELTAQSVDSEPAAERLANSGGMIAGTIGVAALLMIGGAALVLRRRDV